jgi:hypothetical protein
MLNWVLLHAVNLGHGTDGSTSPLKELHATSFCSAPTSQTPSILRSSFNVADKSDTHSCLLFHKGGGKTRSSELHGRKHSSD